MAYTRLEDVLAGLEESSSDTVQLLGQIVSELRAMTVEIKELKSEFHQWEDGSFSRAVTDRLERIEDAIHDMRLQTDGAGQDSSEPGDRTKMGSSALATTGNGVSCPAGNSVFEMMPAGFEPCSRPNLNLIVQFSLTEPDPCDFYLDVRDDRDRAQGMFRAVQGIHPSPLATIRMTGHDFSELAAGRLSADRAFSSGSLGFAGNVGPVGQLRKLYAHPSSEHAPPGAALAFALLSELVESQGYAPKGW